ncbi:hypothetical protein DFJ74DRAFT_763732, partial [Hyaloraphidium curvatum]
ANCGPPGRSPASPRARRGARRRDGVPLHGHVRGRQLRRQRDRARRDPQAVPGLHLPQLVRHQRLRVGRRHLRQRHVLRRRPRHRAAAGHIGRIPRRPGVQGHRVRRRRGGVRAPLGLVRGPVVPLRRLVLRQGLVRRRGQRHRGAVQGRRVLHPAGRRLRVRGQVHERVHREHQGGLRGGCGGNGNRDEDGVGISCHLDGRTDCHLNGRAGVDHGGGDHQHDDVEQARRGREGRRGLGRRCCRGVVRTGGRRRLVIADPSAEVQGAPHTPA